jgi:hypothetical protein
VANVQSRDVRNVGQGTVRGRCARSCQSCGVLLETSAGPTSSCWSGPGALLSVRAGPTFFCRVERDRLPLPTGETEPAGRRRRSPPFRRPPPPRGPLRGKLRPLARRCEALELRGLPHRHGGSIAGGDRRVRPGRAPLCWLASSASPSGPSWNWGRPAILRRQTYFSASSPSKVAVSSPCLATTFRYRSWREPISGRAAL